MSQWKAGDVVSFYGRSLVTVERDGVCVHVPQDEVAALTQSRDAQIDPVFEAQKAEVREALRECMASLRYCPGNSNPEADAKTDRAFSRAEAALRCSKCKGPATRNHESCGTCEGACVGCPGPAAMNAPTSSNACVNQYVHLGPCLKCKKAENNGSGFCASCEPKFAPAEGPKGGR